MGPKGPDSVGGLQVRAGTHFLSGVRSFLHKYLSIESQFPRPFMQAFFRELWKGSQEVVLQAPGNTFLAHARPILGSWLGGSGSSAAVLQVEGAEHRIRVYM